MIRVKNIICIWAGENIHNFASRNDEYYCSSRRLEIFYSVVVTCNVKDIINPYSCLLKNANFPSKQTMNK